MQIVVLLKQIRKSIKSEDNNTIEYLVNESNPADIAAVIHSLKYKERQKLFDLIGNCLNPNTLIWLDYDIKMMLIDTLSVKVVSNIASKLDIGDLLYFIEELDLNTQNDIINSLEISLKDEIIDRLKYDDNTLGRIMDKPKIILPEHWNVYHAKNYIHNSLKFSDSYVAVVVDDKHSPIGMISLSNLLCSDVKVSLHSIMDTNYNALNVDDDVNDAVYNLKKYEKMILPVINNFGKLAGVISFKHVIHLIETEAEDDMLQLSGVSTSPPSTRLLSGMQVRLPWLFINLLIACSISNIIARFGDVISQIAAAAVMMPITAATGGNAAAQTVTVTIRSLSKQYINKYNAVSTIVKETINTTLSGIILSSIACIVCFIMFGSWKISLLFSLSIIINFAIAGFAGSAIPITLSLYDVDPAPPSAILVTACTDAIGFFTFLMLMHSFVL